MPTRATAASSQSTARRTKPAASEVSPGITWIGATRNWAVAASDPKHGVAPECLRELTIEREHFLQEFPAAKARGWGWSASHFSATWVCIVTTASRVCVSRWQADPISREAMRTALDVRARTMPRRRNRMRAIDKPARPRDCAPAPPPGALAARLAGRAAMGSAVSVAIWTSGKSVSDSYRRERLSSPGTSGRWSPDRSQHECSYPRGDPGPEP